MLQRQHLFSVYLHPLPDFGTFPEESIFYGREIQERIQVNSGKSFECLLHLTRPPRAHFCIKAACKLLS